MSTIKKFLIGQAKFKVQGLPQSCLNKLRIFNITNIYYDHEAIVFNVTVNGVDPVLFLTQTKATTKTKQKSFYTPIDIAYLLSI